MGGVVEDEPFAGPGGFIDLEEGCFQFSGANSVAVDKSSPLGPGHLFVSNGIQVGSVSTIAPPEAEQAALEIIEKIVKESRAIN